MNCKICHSLTNTIKIEAPDYWEGVTYSILACKICDTQYAEMMKLARNPLKWTAHMEESHRFIQRQLKESDPHKNKVILEAGPGFGYLTYSLRKAGYNAHGIDISEKAVTAVKKSYGDYYIVGDITRPKSEWLEKFDIICLTEVIEYVPDPVALLKCCFSLLKPNGIVLATTLDKSLSTANFIWGSDLPPIHFWWFSSKGLQEIGRQTNAETIVKVLGNCTIVGIFKKPPNKIMQDDDDYLGSDFIPEN